MLLGGSTSGALAASAPANSVDVWLGKFDGLGNQAWLRQFGSLTFDFVDAIESDGMGGCFVGGRTGGVIAGSSYGG